MTACECLCHDVLDDPCDGCTSPDPTQCYTAPTDPALENECEGCS